MKSRQTILEDLVRCDTFDTDCDRWLLAALVGESYDEYRAVIDAIHFNDRYPEIDSDGRVTGLVIDADSVPADYYVCDVDADGVRQIGGNSADAVISRDDAIKAGFSPHGSRSDYYESRRAR